MTEMKPRTSNKGIARSSASLVINGMNWPSTLIAAGVGLAAPVVTCAAMHSSLVKTPKPAPNQATHFGKRVEAAQTRSRQLPKCYSLQSTLSSWCVKEISLHRQDNTVTARFRVDVSRDGRPDQNEYMIWNDCGTLVFRLLSREPIHLPAIERWHTVRATEDSESHRVLRSLGQLACANVLEASIDPFRPVIATKPTKATLVPHQAYRQTGVRIESPRRTPLMPT